VLANYGISVGYAGVEPTVAIGSWRVVHESNLDDDKQTTALKWTRESNGMSVDTQYFRARSDQDAKT
jgi:hypothetical protein